MKFEHDNDELIELGVASVETRGGPTGIEDLEGGHFPMAGLSDD